MTLPKPIDDSAWRASRAREGGRRRLMLEILGTRSADVRSLADVLHVHPNAVRQHLHVLQRAGLVVAETERGDGQVGRPRTMYRATRRDAAVNPFEHLSRLLVDVVSGRSPFEVGRQDGMAAVQSDSRTDAAKAVADVASRAGFSVRVERDGDGAVIELGQCPFASVAGEAVCDLHMGIVHGAATAANGAVRSFDIRDPAREPCRVVVDMSPTH